ncbi:hypothetical protein NC651_032031 [Populus alba x Populus x berolinensis]|nr:hypothetical protein NC651_032031 [Populus alba x Populus x berolinensis]
MDKNCRGVAFVLTNFCSSLPQDQQQKDVSFLVIECRFHLRHSAFDVFCIASEAFSEHRHGKRHCFLPVDQGELP